MAILSHNEAPCGASGNANELAAAWYNLHGVLQLLLIGRLRKFLLRSCLCECKHGGMISHWLSFFGLRANQSAWFLSRVGVY
jgi:hypothetical protein